MVPTLLAAVVVLAIANGALLMVVISQGKRIALLEGRVQGISATLRQIGKQTPGPESVDDGRQQNHPRIAGE